jgi:hypothetical protein
MATLEAPTTEPVAWQQENSYVSTFSQEMLMNRTHHETYNTQEIHRQAVRWLQNNSIEN